MSRHYEADRRILTAQASDLRDEISYLQGFLMQAEEHPYSLPCGEADGAMDRLHCAQNELDETERELAALNRCDHRRHSIRGI